MLDEPDLPSAHVDPVQPATEGYDEVDIGAADYEALRVDEEPVPAAKESKSHEALRLMLDPANKEAPKSLWRGLFLPSLTTLSNIETLKLKYGDDSKKAYLEWYNQLLMLHRSYLQTSFEAPDSLPDLSKRVANYLGAKKHGKLEWRHQWIAEYTKYMAEADQELQNNIALAKEAAKKKREFKLQERRKQLQESAPER